MDQDSLEVFGETLEIARAINKGKDRVASLEEVFEILGGECPVQKGDVLYHFSNTKHPIGSTGRKEMCFTSVDDVETVECEMDRFSQIYSHACEIVGPNYVREMAYLFVGAFREDFIKEAQQGLHDHRWYEALEDGAIRVVSVEEV
tara:strand:- start:3865 stop:4302 length:438 start_codon:yes stop_codon:yes gene_type:complete